MIPLCMRFPRCDYVQYYHIHCKQTTGSSSSLHLCSLTKVLMMIFNHLPPGIWRMYSTHFWDISTAAVRWENMQKALLKVWSHFYPLQSMGSSWMLIVLYFVRISWWSQSSIVYESLHFHDFCNNTACTVKHHTRLLQLFTINCTFNMPLWF